MDANDRTEDQHKPVEKWPPLGSLISDSDGVELSMSSLAESVWILEFSDRMDIDQRRSERIRERLNKDCVRWSVLSCLSNVAARTGL